MARLTAVYSVVQYSPEIARGEAANVGVVLMSPDHGAVRARFSTNNEHVKRLFGRDSYDDVRLTSAKTALEKRLLRLAPDPVELRAFIEKEGGSLVFQQPREIVVVDPDDDIAALFDELVGERERRTRRRRPTGPDAELRTHFDQLLLARVPLTVDARVELPVLKTELHAPYAYQNGGMHYVKPFGFADDEGWALEDAQELATQGRLLARHPLGRLTRHLVVVGAFADAASEQKIRALLGDFDVRLVLDGEIAAYAEEVRRVAH